MDLQKNSSEEHFSQTCPDCGLIKPKDAFPVRGKGILNRRKACIDCYLKRRRASWRKHDAQRNSERRQKWANDVQYRDTNKLACAKYRQEKRDVIASKTRERNRLMRQKVLERYGGKCECCLESRLEFLVIDHTAGGGNQERISLSPHGVYRKLDKADSLLDGYRVLCHNCNSAYAYYGYCPHQQNINEPHFSVRVC